VRAGGDGIGRDGHADRTDLGNASGTPVVSADHPGGVELHELFGDDVLVVPKANIGSLTTALTDALADPRRVRPDTLRIVSERFRRRPIEAAYAANLAWRARWETEHGRKLTGRKPTPPDPDSLAKRRVNVTDPDTRMMPGHDEPGRCAAR
jgi:hypothetical protein